MLNEFGVNLWPKIPYFGHKSVQFGLQISKLIEQNFYHLKPNAIQVNSNKISNIFSYKDKLPKNLQSSVVYQYSCPQECGSVYVGSTVRTLETRIAEHRGVSIRSNKALSTPSHSSIRSHHSSSNSQCRGEISLEQFVVLGSCKGVTGLRILESLHIIHTRPSLNEMSSAFPLKIVKF